MIVFSLSQAQQMGVQDFSGVDFHTSDDNSKEDCIP
jgi:hypothetical protein